jgi:hypothetical protein
MATNEVATHTVVITVTGDNPNDYALVADPPTLIMGEGPYALITFVMNDSPYWTFAPNGAVALKVSSPQFPLASMTNEDGRTVKLFDYNTDEREYSYDVTVVHTLRGHQVVRTFDPGIKNGR